MIISPQNPSQDPLPPDGSNAFATAAAIDGRKQHPGQNQSSPSSSDARGYPGHLFLSGHGSAAASATSVDATSSPTHAPSNPRKGGCSISFNLSFRPDPEATQCPASIS
ncbi:hypothetical protein PIB30_008234 [Stylosanthes scabra]|uniref:Uncharacterized protein n=1 Tax=Stylosanthes scabra TaxID=79078 RepID=A0ABU6Q4T0_9FABA|nr:hypothetical protein [Stylosanthes scabra]